MQLNKGITWRVPVSTLGRLELPQNSGHTEQPSCIRLQEVCHNGKTIRQRISKLEEPFWHLKLGRYPLYASGLYRARCCHVIICSKFGFTIKGKTEGIQEENTKEITHPLSLFSPQAIVFYQLILSVLAPLREAFKHVLFFS